MRIGIITFSCAFNYGAVLQCHALYSTIKSLGYDVDVVDYRPPYLFYPRPTLSVGTIIKYPYKSYKALPFYFSYRKYFDKFIFFEKKQWHLTQTVSSKDELSAIIDTYDCIVLGSDQIWNRNFNGGDEVWYGILNHTGKTKYVTYAASAGDAIFNNDDFNLLKRALSVLSFVSVRESKLANILLLNFSFKAQIVLDPTLLADEKVWRVWYKPIINKDYIVVYQARADNNVFRIAEELCKQMKVKKIVVLDSHPNVKQLGYKSFSASPSEFVSVIRNAKFVVTTSFHGTAFSIITEVPFYTLRLNDGADERTQHLLSSLGIADRLIDKLSTPQWANLNFQEVKRILNTQRKESLNFLKQSIT